MVVLFSLLLGHRAPRLSLAKRRNQSPHRADGERSAERKEEKKGTEASADTQRRMACDQSCHTRAQIHHFPRSLGRCDKSVNADPALPCAACGAEPPAAPVCDTSQSGRQHLPQTNTAEISSQKLRAKYVEMVAASSQTVAVLIFCMGNPLHIEDLALTSCVPCRGRVYSGV